MLIMDYLLVALWAVVLGGVIYLNCQVDYLDPDDKLAMFVCLPARLIKRLRNKEED